MSEFHQKIPQEPGKKSAIILAGLMHVLLVLFLWIGIRWQSQTPVGVEAEIWDMHTRAAAPVPISAPTPTPPMPQQVKKQPEPDVKESIQEQEREAEIALERARAKQLEAQLETKRIEKERQEKRKEELAEKKKQEETKLAEQKKQEAAKLTEQKKVDALIQQQRRDNLQRLAGQVGATGDAVKSTGNNRVDPSYAGKIAAKIKSNMVYVGTDSGPTNPTVEFVVNLFPDGSLKGAPRKTKTSGVPAFDDAVERAITKSAPYPADKSGKVPTTIPLTYRLKD